VTGDLQRLVPGSPFAGLPPGGSLKIEYLTSLITNVSFVPLAPYLVFDDTPDVGHALIDYVALPFDRGPQGPGRDPRVVTPTHQYALDTRVRDIPLAELPHVFPTAVEVGEREGELHLRALPAVEAPAELQSEARFAAEYLAPYFDKSPAPPGAPVVRLATGTIGGQTSREAYELEVDPKQGIRILGASPAGVF
jgi:hexosaminidase